MKNNKRDWGGIIKFNNGNFYEMDFKNDLLEGKGIWININGNVYEWDFRYTKNFCMGSWVCLRETTKNSTKNISDLYFSYQAILYHLGTKCSYPTLAKNNKRSAVLLSPFEKFITISVPF